MKIVYLARHGQTVANLENQFQGLDDPLTPVGEMQAEKLAERASNLDFELLVSSDAARAAQTAGTISKRTGHALETSELFRETRVPTSLIGLKRSSPEAEKYISFWQGNMDADGRYEDEESFNDLIKRGIAAIEYLEQRPEEKIFVVTHGMFLRIMTALIIMNKNLTFETWQRFYESMRTDNTGLSLWRRDADRWLLITWNDHAHLG